MKKTYVSPLIVFVSSEATNMICASETYKLNNGTQIGATSEQSPYGNDDYLNEGHSSDNVGGYDVVSGGTDENDEIFSRSKSSLLWDW